MATRFGNEPAGAAVGAGVGAEAGAGAAAELWTFEEESPPPQAASNELAANAIKSARIRFMSPPVE
jgi:hypothetical protein